MIFWGCTEGELLHFQGEGKRTIGRKLGREWKRRLTRGSNLREVTEREEKEEVEEEEEGEEAEERTISKEESSKGKRERSKEASRKKDSS